MRLLDELSSLADGDLTVQATVTEDITGAIADSINYAIEALRELVTTINDSAIQLDGAAKQTQAAAAHMAKASGAQSRQITAASESMADMAASIEEVSGNSERCSDVARHSVDIAHKGGDAVRRTIDGMNAIRETIQETSKRIKRLGESSQEIGNIVELINDIAEQTNILALNASIQASMAGEAGRGFAVVADEVQRLAERAANATKQIEVLVRTIQTDTNEAVVSMERSTTDVVGGALLAENAGAALEEIEQVSNQIANLVQNISASARQQAVASGQHLARTCRSCARFRRRPRRDPPRRRPRSANWRRWRRSCASRSPASACRTSAGAPASGRRGAPRRGTARCPVAEVAPAPACGGCRGQDAQGERRWRRPDRLAASRFQHDRHQFPDAARRRQGTGGHAGRCARSLEAYAERLDQRASAGELRRAAASRARRAAARRGLRRRAARRGNGAGDALPAASAGGDEKRQADGLDALMRAMVQLPDLPGARASGGRDLALVLLPLLNDLRAVRGSPLLSEGTLLLLNLKSDQPAQPRPPTPDEPALDARVGAAPAVPVPDRPAGLIRGESVEQNLDIMAQVAGSSSRSRPRSPCSSSGG